MPAEALIQACCACHNDILDQSISRARFNIALQRIDGPEIAVAIERLLRAGGEPGAMPPEEARELDTAGRARLIEYLRRSPYPADDLARLDQAAKQGMAGNTEASTQL